MKPLVFKIATFIFCTLLLLYFLIIPISVAFFATRDKHSDVSAPPKNFEEVEFKTEDNVKIAAWYKAPENNITVLLVHGSGNNRDSVKSEAEFLNENKFGVLVIDLRGFGESEGKTNSFGWQGEKDIKAAIKFIKEQDSRTIIYAWGKSLGGELLLASAKDNPEIEKIISEGATYRYFKEFNDLKFTSSLAQNLSVERFVTFWVQTFGNKKPSITISESLKSSKDTKFLFIAAGKEKMEIKYNSMFKDFNPANSELWVIDNISHTQGFSKNTEEYKFKVLKFYGK